MSNERTRFGALLKQLRRERDISLADLAGATYVSRGWINNVEAGRRWPTRQWVDQAERALGAEGSLVPEWESMERRHAAESEVNALLSTSVRESQLLLASQPDAVSLDDLQKSVADTAVAYLANPAQPMLRQAMILRQELMRRLTSGAVRPSDITCQRRLNLDPLATREN